MPRPWLSTTVNVSGHGEPRRTATPTHPTRSHIARCVGQYLPTPCAGIVRAWAVISDDLRRGKACSGSSCLIQLMQNHALVSQDVVIALHLIRFRCRYSTAVCGRLPAPHHSSQRQRDKSFPPMSPIPPTNSNRVLHRSCMRCMQCTRL